MASTDVWIGMWHLQMYEWVCGTYRCMDRMMSGYFIYTQKPACVITDRWMGVRHITRVMCEWLMVCVCLCVSWTCRWWSLGIESVGPRMWRTNGTELNCSIASHRQRRGSWWCHSTPNGRWPPRWPWCPPPGWRKPRGAHCRCVQPPD